MEQGGGDWFFFAVPSKLKPILNMLKNIIKRVLYSCKYTYTIAAIEAFESDHSEYLKKTTDILSAVGNYVYENLKSNKVLIQKPEGGFYLMPEF